MKKTFVLLLALCMAAVLFAVPAFAEGEEGTLPVEAGITDESGLNEALSNPKAGSTVTLGADITLTAPVTVPQSVTLEGAGYALTANFDSKDNMTSAVVYANGSVKNLTVNAASRVKYAVQVYGPEMDVELAQVVMTNGKYSGLIVNNGASAKLTGCTFTGNGFSAVELADGKDHSGAAPKLTVDSLEDSITVRADVNENAQPVLTVSDNGPVLTARVNGQTVYANNSEAMLAALCGTQGATEIALGDSIELTQPLKVTQPVAVNGNGHALTVMQDITGVSGYGNAVTVEADGVTLSNLTVNANNKAKYAVHVYNVENVTLEKVTAVNGLYNGVLVNGSTVTMKDMTFDKNGEMGGIELGRGENVPSNPKVTLEGTIDSDKVDKVLYADVEEFLDGAADVSAAIENKTSNLNITVGVDGSVTTVDKDAQPDPKPEEKPQDKPSAPAPAAPAPAKANPKTGVKA